MLVLDQICNVYFFKDLYLLRFCRKIKTTNTCIHQHKHRSSNTILGKNPTKVDIGVQLPILPEHLSSHLFGALDFTPFRSTWVQILPELLNSHPSGALELTPFRSTWVHILPEHFSSHPFGALQFTPFRSTSVHIWFLVVFLFVFLDLFFYVVFCRSLSVPLFFFFWIFGCGVLLRLKDTGYPFGIFKLFLCLHGAKIKRWWTDFINVHTWNLKEESTVVQKYKLYTRSVGNHKKNIDAINTRDKSHFTHRNKENKSNHGFIVNLQLEPLPVHQIHPWFQWALCWWCCQALYTVLSTFVCCCFCYPS